jgi:hypothetical protein
MPIVRFRGFITSFTKTPILTIIADAAFGTATAR